MRTSNPIAVTGASDILQNGLNASQSIAQTWDKQWLHIFQSELYYSIVNLAGLFAAFALVFFFVQFLRRMILEEDLAASLQSLILPIIIAGLLFNHGLALAHGTIALRGVIHNVSDKVLSTTLLQVKLQDAVQASVDKGAVSSEISALMSQCEGMVGDKQTACLQAANQQAQAIIQDYQSKHPVSNAMAGLITGFEQASPITKALTGAVTGAVSEAGGSDGHGGASVPFGAAGFIGGALGAIDQTLVQTILLAFQWGFANILEISLLLTGLMGPLAVAGALMFDGKSLWAWLTGFFSLGMAQVSYNIIVGIAGVVVVNADVTDTMGFLVIIALLAPALALALAAGGGMTVFSVVNAGASGAFGTIARSLPSLSIPL